MFNVKNLNFAFKKNSALILDDINLKLLPQKCVGLIGNNGSGKSTLAYALVGIIPEIYKGFLRGRFIYDGNSNYSFLNKFLLEDEIDLFKLPISERLNLISYTFQDNESQILFGTVADIIGLNETNTDKQLINQIIEILGIEHLLSRTANQLSSGESQKVVLTSSFRNNPQLLIYDEATSALDPIVKRDFKKFVDFLLKEEKSVLLLGQSSEILSEYTSANYLLENAKIKSYKGTSQKIPLKKEMKFWENLNVESEKAHAFEISRLLYTRKSSNFELNINNFKVEKGQNVALLGRNGSGKSTFLNALGGLIKPKKIVSDLSDFFEHTRLIFQSPTSQIIGATIEEELNSQGNLSEQQKSLIKNHFPFLDFARDPLDLSFGQQRILCLLSAFLSSKPILLIDEPELGVDPNNLNYIKAFFRLNNTLRNKTILFATHDLELALDFSDLCVMINEGSISLSAKPRNKKELEDWFFDDL